MNTSQAKSNEEEISLCFQAAIERLEKGDADAKEKQTQIVQDAEKEKTQIVKDLAKDLEGKIPTDRISDEIIYQLHGKVSEELMNRLDEKYKDHVEDDPYASGSWYNE